MQAFMDNARIQLVDHGIKFYERDILMCKYKFNRYIKIDILLDYNRSGFGVLLCSDDNQGPMLSLHKYMFHQGTNNFSVIERHRNSQTTTKERTNLLAPGSKIKLRFEFVDQKIKLYLLEKNDIAVENGAYELGEYYLARKMKNYYIGLYSAEENIIRECCFYQAIPDLWHASIKNTYGGRISFIDDGFQIDGSLYDAEIEQQNILLPKGGYFFSYEKEDFEGQNDIEGFLYPTKIPDRPTEDDPKFKKKWDAFDGQWFEDEVKNLTDERGYFYLDSDTEVIVSFKGTIGRVKNIMINDNSQGAFVSTRDKPEISDGSWIEIKLTGEEENGADDIVKIEWEGLIYDVPSYTDLSLPCPYGIIVTTKTRLRLEQCNVSLGEEYLYRYLVADKVLNTYKIEEITEQITETDTVKVSSGILDITSANRDTYIIEYDDVNFVIDSDNTISYSFIKEENFDTYLCTIGPDNINGQNHIKISRVVPKDTIVTSKREKFLSSRYVSFSELENSIQIFRNMKAQIKNLTLFYKDGSNINLNLRRIYTDTIPKYIKGPVIVTDVDGNSFELMSSYREVVDLDSYHIDIFSKNALEMLLTYHTTDLAYAPEVYGIHTGVTIDKTKTDIDSFTIANNDTKKYTKISNWTLKDDKLTVPTDIRNEYPYIAIRYQRADKYHYYFSVYEREVFDGEEDILQLEKTMNESGADLYVYGIPGNDNFREEYLLRVPATEDTIFYTSIDLCARAYDLISPLDYDVDTEDSSIYLHYELHDKYQYYIVDYLRYDSYTINEKFKTATEMEEKNNEEISDLYIINVVSDKPEMYIHYEYDSSTKNSSSVKRTDIEPDQNKFIILKRKEGYPYED